MTSPWRVVGFALGHSGQTEHIVLAPIVGSAPDRGGRAAKAACGRTLASVQSIQTRSMNGRSGLCQRCLRWCETREIEVTV